MNRDQGHKLPRMIRTETKENTDELGEKKGSLNIFRSCLKSLYVGYVIQTIPQVEIIHIIGIQGNGSGNATVE